MSRCRLPRWSLQAPLTLVVARFRRDPLRRRAIRKYTAESYPGHNFFTTSWAATKNRNISSPRCWATRTRDTCAPGTLRRRLLDRPQKLTEVQAELAMDELEKTIATQRPLISNTVWEELNAAINTHGFGDSTDDDMFKAQPGTTYYFTDEQKRRLEKKVAYSMKEAKIGSCLSLIWFTGEWMVFEAGTFGKFKFELANMIQPTLVKCKMCAPLFKSAGSVGFSTAGGFST